VTPKHFILDNRVAVETDSALEWAKWMRDNDPRVAFTCIKNIIVSTVFLGIDHGHRWRDKIVLFETMVFGIPDQNPVWRTSTWEEAEAMHNKVCGIILRGEKL
jgi:hypothetical protein